MRIRLTDLAVKKAYTEFGTYVGLTEKEFGIPENKSETIGGITYNRWTWYELTSAYAHVVVVGGMTSIRWDYPASVFLRVVNSPAAVTLLHPPGMPIITFRETAGVGKGLLLVMVGADANTQVKASVTGWQYRS